MSSSEKKPSLESLPDDLLLKCIACVSRLHYPTLSLVSKRFRSLLASPELYKVRSLLGRTESCLYVCIKFSPGDFRWFTLSREPDLNITNDTGYILSKVPALPFPCPPGAAFSNFVAVGSDIYKIGGEFHFGEASSIVSILDCRSHTWREGPSSRVELRSATANVLDQNIYVVGYDSLYNNTFQVLDTTTQVWDPEPISPGKTTFYDDIFTSSTCVDGKFRVVNIGDENFAYHPEEGKWELGPWVGVGGCLSFYSYSDIGNVFFGVGVGDGLIRWYDTEKRSWRILEGLVGLDQFYDDGSCVRLADYGGKIVVFSKQPCGLSMYRIWCAVIALERRERGGIFGQVEWRDCVLTVPYFRLSVSHLSNSIYFHE